MRRSLGSAVFGGMLGVTVFGIFLTPVFYYVIQWFGEGKAEKPHQDMKDEHDVMADGLSNGKAVGAHSTTLVE
jgi:multidrug efflux pump